MNNQVATALVQLWDEYLASEGLRVFQPTMTDFMRWIRKQQSEQESNPARTLDELVDVFDRGGLPALADSVKKIKGSQPDQIEDAQSTGDGPLTSLQIHAIKRLYREGNSAARVRQMLGLKVSIGRIYAIVGKK